MKYILFTCKREMSISFIEFNKIFYHWWKMGRDKLKVSKNNFHFYINCVDDFEYCKFGFICVKFNPKIITQNQRHI